MEAFQTSSDCRVVSERQPFVIESSQRITQCKEYARGPVNTCEARLSLVNIRDFS